MKDSLLRILIVQLCLFNNEDIALPGKAHASTAGCPVDENNSM
jgi:hypothetical protein